MRRATASALSGWSTAAAAALRAVWPSQAVVGVRGAAAPLQAQRRHARHRLTQEEIETVENALAIKEAVEQYELDLNSEIRGEERDEVILYEPKPLFFEEKLHDGAMLMRDFIHAAMWGIPNRFRSSLGFLQRGRLQELKQMVDKMYDSDFSTMSAGEFDSMLIQLKNQPMLRPKIPSILNPEFARTILNYMLKQMRKLGMKRLIIYEAWGMNGQTALGILDILAEEYPEIYRSCEYHMVDVCGIWMTHRDVYVQSVHMDHYFEHHISLFDWEVLVEDRHFFLCLETLSCLPFDKVHVSKHSGTSNANLQGCTEYVYEVFMHEEVSFDDRAGNTYTTTRRHSMYDTVEWFRPLQDGLIKEYMRHVDFDGVFSQERINQTYHDLVQGKPEARTPQPSTALDARMRTRIINPTKAIARICGVTNHEYFIPSLHVSLCDKLRRYFPRHTLIAFDHSSQHTNVRGVNPPICYQYFNGQTIHHIELLLNEGLMGVSEVRYMVDFSQFRQLYYSMMELPPEHPLHLRVMDLESFFGEYGSEDVMKSLTVEGLKDGIDQPVQNFRGARFIVAEFGGNKEEVQDAPLDASLNKGHFRQQVYNTVFGALINWGVIDNHSLLDMRSYDTQVDHNQCIDTTPVLQAIGENPTPAQLDVPVGFYTKQQEKKRLRVLSLEQASVADAQSLLATKPGDVKDAEP
eukprot:TRINITY_DN23736_c0_g1_i1.p1 TRINITY_DN23736_c0_g1~~TRINITY_DN23736_c0_g1_i1.p1  ORF type:complete len:690 (+),score=158.08 TRINITY_DN23736_c0_g1_i1:101-2170(+)